jgi:hypothetical protein
MTSSALDYPNRETVLLEYQAWKDPISQALLNRPLKKNIKDGTWELGQPWLQGVAYKVVGKKPKGNKPCVVILHDKEINQRAVVPIQHIWPSHLSRENLADLMRYKQTCLWCDLTGNFSKRGNEAIVCQNNLHSCRFTLGIENREENCKLHLHLEVKNAFDLTFNFVDLNGQITHLTSTNIPVPINGIVRLDQVIKSVKKLPRLY